MEKKIPFTLPEDYFDQLQNKIEQSIISEQNKDLSEGNNSSSSTFKRYLWIAAAAAVLVGVVFSGFELVNMQNEVYRQAEEVMAQDNYEDYVLDELDFFQIEDVLADSDY